MSKRGGKQERESGTTWKGIGKGVDKQSLSLLFIKSKSAGFRGVPDPYSPALAP